MFDIAAIGECLIDFTPEGRTEEGLPLYSQNPGGAPANVLAMASRLGARTAFIGKVGKDSFGSFLRKKIEDAGICVDNLISDSAYPTTLAVVALDDRGDRSFSFYRERSADVMLEREEVDQTLLSDTKIFHFGSVSMTADPARTTTLSAVKEARKNGVIISYDPNFRPFLWKDVNEARAILSSSVSLCDIIKVSEEELALITGTSDMEKGSLILLNMGARLAVVTLGREGAYVRQGNETALLRTYDVRTVDTTGAGDAFLGSLLYILTNKLGVRKREDLTALPFSLLKDAVRFSNAAGSLTTEKKGAIPAMPEEKRILECIRTAPLI